MKKSLLILLLAIFFVPLAHGQMRGQANMHKRVEEYEKVKLIEVLNLDETRSVQFFVKRKEFRDKQREITSQIDSLVLRMKRLEKKPDKEKTKELINQYVEKEKQMHALRSGYISELRNILTEEELAKFIVFEREFRKDLQEMILKRGKKNMRGMDF
ncbi:MAG: hypothetical protein HUU54_02360 [Ignavibacteriaceae bacterium]|nr:hypothetical protein [Ignavibacteriaceae bacterium]